MGDDATTTLGHAGRVEQRALGLLFLAGALIGALSLALPHGGAGDDGALWMNIALAAAGGATLLVLPALPPWTAHASLVAGTIVISRAVYYGGPDSYYAIWYAWAAAFACSFFPRRQAAAHLALVAAAYAVVLVAQPGHAPLPRWLTTIATIAVAGAFLDALATRVRRQAVRLEELALSDALTGLPNRRAWEEELPRQLSRAARDGRPLCVLMLDLDVFKAYNDRYGHLAGDALLVAAAREWSTRIRGGDVLARYGGEEFVLALPDCALPFGIDLAQRLAAATPEGQTCSIGVAEWDGDEDPGALLARADHALYAAKRAGRNRVRGADDPALSPSR